MPKSETLDDLIDLIANTCQRGLIQVPSGLSESLALIEALKAKPDAADGKTFAGLFIPGVNGFDYSSLHPTARMETPLMAAHLREGFEAGRVRPLQISYRQAYRRLSSWPTMQGIVEVGICVVTPGEGDTFSFGVSADAGPAVLTGARVKVALVNESAPRVPGKRTVTAPRDAFDLIVPVNEPLNWVSRESLPVGPMLAAASWAAGSVNDGDTVQVGIGKLPSAVLHNLRDRSNLKIHSGLFADGVLELVEEGALSNKPNALVAGAALGGRRLGEALARDPRARFAPVSETHDPRVIARHPRFKAINGALQVDLFGQVNAEFVNGRLVSGPGGLPDFVEGANLSMDGRAIIALPSTAGSESRIVARLETPWVTLGPRQAHEVVTEFGAADLKSKTADGLAENLIAIAHPDHRAALSAAWGQIRARL